MMAGKNFTNVLQKDKTFDGVDISQTYEEHEESKREKNRSNDEPKRRISLYLPESIYARVSMFASISRTNMNQLIIGLIEEGVTQERMYKAMEDLQKDLRNVNKY